MMMDEGEEAMTVLKVLAKVDQLRADCIAANCSISIAQVNVRLGRLEKHGFVREDDGWYSITSVGEAYLHSVNGEVEALEEH